MKDQLTKFIQSKNIAEDLDETQLNKIGNDVIMWFDEDEATRKEWCDRNDSWLKLATQVMEPKTYPWPQSANVKFPLLTTAAMQFAARAYPALVPGPRLVTGLVIGKDEGGMKQQVADRIGSHMSYQLLYDMDNWEEEMDKLCLMLPIIGCIFKKTYYDPVEKKNCSELVLPNDLVIDYYAKSLEKASRKSHIIFRTDNEIYERVQRGLFRDVDLGQPVGDDKPHDARDKIDGAREPTITPATPHKFIECHCSWDLDEDGYDEPYVITVHYDSRKVVRIVTRFDVEGIETVVKGKNEEIVKIKPIEYFTKFGFIPNPDGSIYDLGFGLLLGGINETVNTLTNQLLDSGTLNNLQSGFLGRGIRIRSGNTKFIPGEWKPVDFSGDDIKKHIFPLPTKEPSEVLFKLLETLVTSGKELASVAEIFVGKMPGQNTPATTTMATIEQGLKVFTAIYKRIYRALGKEYEKLFYLNGKYLPDSKIYFTINEPQGPQSQEIEKQDYSNPIIVKPNSDPNVVSSAQKLMKVQSYGPLLEIGTIQPIEYTKRYLEAVEAENISALINTQPKPDPEQQKMQMEAQIKERESQMKMQVEQLKAQLEMQKMQMEIQFKQIELKMKAQEHQLDLQSATQEHQLNMQATQEEHAMDMTQSRQQHSQDMQLGQEQHKQDMTIAKDKAAMQKQQMKQKASQSNGTSRPNK